MEMGCVEAQPTIRTGEQMTTLVHEFVTYCEQNGMPSDDVGSAAFLDAELAQDSHPPGPHYGGVERPARRRVAGHPPATVCPIAPHHGVGFCPCGRARPK